MKILLTGGGTLGPVTPLLALVEYWRGTGKDLNLVWVGTVNGPEAQLITAKDIRFISIASVKIPRYLTPYLLVVPFMGIYALIEAWNVLKKEQPDVIVSAGGYVSVPLVILGRLLGVKSWIHQQDIVPGLANKIMSKFAAKISVTFKDSVHAFPARKMEVTGNAVRASLTKGSREKALKKFGLSKDRKTLLVLGGGAGSTWVNKSVSAIAGELSKKWQVLHVAGRDKLDTVLPASEHYSVEPMIGEGMDDAYAAADIVLCRAGLGTMTELAAIGKPAIVIPIPDTHQEMNAFFLYEHQAAIILDQTETTPQVLLAAIKSVMDDEDVRIRLTANMKLSFPKDGTKKIGDGVLELARESDAKWVRGTKKMEAGVEKEVQRTENAEVTQEKEDEAMESIEAQIARALGGDRKGDLEKPEDDPFNIKKV